MEDPQNQVAPTEKVDEESKVDSPKEESPKEQSPKEETPKQEAASEGEKENVNKGSEKKQENVSTKSKLEDAAREVMKQLDSNNFNQAYQGAIIDRKEESFNAFHAKEQERKTMAEARKGITSSILIHLEGRINWINNGVEKTIKFFNDRAAQEEQYTKLLTVGLPKLSSFFKDESQPQLFMNLGKALEESDQFHVRQAKNSELLAKVIRKEILEGIILPAEKDFKKQFDAMKGPLEEIKRKFNSFTQEKGKKIKAYIFAYNEAQRQGKMTKEKDMFHKELEYIAMGQEELVLIKQYGSQVVTMVTEVVKLLNKRFGEIQKGLNLYFLKYVDLYGVRAANPEVVMQLLQKFNTAEEVQQIFALKSCLSNDELKYIRENTKKDEVTYQDVFNLVNNVPSNPTFIKSPLVLKEWKATRDAGLLKGSKQCNLVVTIDGHILVIDKLNDGECLKAEYILTLKSMKIINNDDKRDYSHVEVLEVVPGLLMDSKTKLLFKFENVDSAEEFRHYVYNFYNANTIEQKR